MSYCIHQGDCFGIDFEKKSFFFLPDFKNFCIFALQKRHSKGTAVAFFCYFCIYYRLPNNIRQPLKIDFQTIFDSGRTDFFFERGGNAVHCNRVRKRRKIR